MDEEIQKWRSCALLDQKMLALLNDEKNPIHEYFEGRVAFGTGGMRGLIGPGPNRINEVTIARVTAGLGDFLIDEKKVPKEAIKVVIGYDNRYFSRRFAEIAGAILAAKKIQVFVFEQLTPTPIVSYAIRKMQAQAGIMITASHNSKEYNGYKVYDATGCQILPDRVADLNEFAEKYHSSFAFPRSQEEITWLDEAIEADYLSEFDSSIKKEKKNLSIGYSPEHGTGGRVVKKLFDRYGFDQVIYPVEQWHPDPAFSNTKSPNPEVVSSFELLIHYGKKYKLDLLLATDPDADRLGAFYRDHKGEYVRLTGNQIGAILLEYLMEKQTPEELQNKYIVKTIVSSDLAKKIAQSHGCEVVEVLTGFKYIGDTINKKGADRFLFAYEESFGFLANPVVRDKDGLQIALILSEVANYLKKRGETLGDYLATIYANYGYFGEEAISVALTGKEKNVSENNFYEKLSTKLSKEATIMEDFDLQKRVDLKTGKTTALQLPQARVRKFYFEDNNWVCIRPSGTEPKLKIYIGVGTNSLEKTKKTVDTYTKKIATIVEELHQ